MPVKLDWIGVTVEKTTDLLWYLTVSPPPNEIAEDKEDFIDMAQAPPSEISPHPFLIVDQGIGSETKAFQRPTEIENGIVADEAGKALLPFLPSETPLVEPPEPAMFALTIGINEYASEKVSNLSGAVPDADEMVSFLTDILHVPADHISSLRDAEATRQAIEGAIIALGDDGRIEKDDPILIYYAGHGAEAKSPPGWPGDRDVQMLVPHDFEPYSTGDKDKGQGLVDIRLGHLLQQVAEKKGNNITVILDSCYSGSGTRDENDATYSVRGVDLNTETYQVAPGLLGDLPSGRASSIAKGFETSGLLSHVLLAACAKGQTAKERQGRGAFTQALLGLWREESVDLLTYKDVILRLPDIPLQNPQCEGVHQSRVLFNSRVSIPRQIFRVTCERAGLYILEAGDAHGITAEAQFTIFTDRTLKQSLGDVIAKSPTVIQTELVVIQGQPPFAFEGIAFAIQTRVGTGSDVKLLLPPDSRLFSTFVKIKNQMQKAEADKRGITLVDDMYAQPDLVVSLVKDTEGEDVAAFDVMDKTCRQYGLTRMPLTSKLDPQTLFHTLRASADFYWNLNRSSDESIISRKVEVSCYRLYDTGEYDDDFRTISKPDMQLGDLNVGGMITIYVEDNHDYGYSIKNRSAVPLFASLFYFDMSDLSIFPYYQPPSAKDGETDASIPPGGELTIGYGSSGTPSYTYSLRPNQDVDVGYLKLFLSTTYIDHSNIVQSSPFQEKRGSSKIKPKKRTLWETVKIAIVQRNGERGEAVQG